MGISLSFLHQLHHIHNSKRKQDNPSSLSPIEDVDRAALVDEDYLDCIIFYFNGDDHRVILLVIEALKIVVREGYGGHATFVMRMGDVVDGLDMMKVSLSSR